MIQAPPLVLVDVGHSRSPHVGLGQVAMQYARALAARPDDAFRFRFLIQPGFHAFPAAVPGADIVRAKFSAVLTDSASAAGHVHSIVLEEGKLEPIFLKLWGVETTREIYYNAPHAHIGNPILVPVP